MFDGREAAEILGSVYSIAVRGHGSEEALGTSNLSSRALFWALEKHLTTQQLNSMTSPQQMRIALENCLEKTAFKELLPRLENKRLRRAAAKLRHSRLTQLIPDLARNEEKLMFVMGAWREMIGCVVGVLTLRWEQRFETCYA